MKKMTLLLALALTAGCGFDWFPSHNTPFKNTTTVFVLVTSHGRFSTAHRALPAGLYGNQQGGMVQPSASLYQTPSPPAVSATTN
jgi:outer membrane lipopolysaccharide assembly protein LptE/RlpB